MTKTAKVGAFIPFDQTCPHCDITEAAGASCTRCARVTQPEWVHKRPRSGYGAGGVHSSSTSSARHTATESPDTGPSGTSAHPEPEEGS